MDFSIIIATKDRGKEIDLTFDSLLSLKKNNYQYEIIIIDNRSSKENKELLLDIQKKNPNLIKYIREDKIGLSNARNRGIKESSGEIIAFVDDDAIIPPHWMVNILNHFKLNSSAYVIGSKVIAQFTSPPPSWLTKELEVYISSFDKGEESFIMKYNEYPRGVNMAFRKDAFIKAGIFLDCFGRKGKSLMSYEEIEICYRIEKLGYNIVYIPNAEVYHLIRGNRLNDEWFIERHYWQGRSEGLFEIIHYGRKHIRDHFLTHLKNMYSKENKYKKSYHKGFIVAIFQNYFKRNFK